MGAVRVELTCTEVAAPRVIHYATPPFKTAAAFGLLPFSITHDSMKYMRIYQDSTAIMPAFSS